MFGQALPMDSELEIDMNQPKDFNFEFEIGLKPEFEITPLKKKGSITRYVIRVDDELIEKELTYMQEQRSEIENIEHLEEQSDIAYISYQECAEDGTVNEGAEVFQDAKALEELPAKIAERLKGKAVDESFVFQPAELMDESELPSFLKDVLKTDDEGKANAFYKLTLTLIGRSKVPEMNQEFFEQVFPNSGIEDEAGFKEKLAEELKKELGRVATDRVQNEIFETLIHETPMELPVAFLKNWFKGNGEAKKTDEEVEQEYPSFEHQLRWSLISDKLINQHEISVSLDEVMQDLKSKVMGYFGMTAETDAPWMDSYLEKMSKDNKTMDETYRRLLFDKLFDKLQEIFEVQDKEVSADEFNQLPMSHHH